MKSIIAAGLGAVLFAGAGVAAFAQSRVTEGKNVKAGVYSAEPYHTQALFTVSHFGLSNFSGVITGASGSLKLDPAHPANSKLEVSLDTGTILTPVQKLTDELRGENWLDSGKYPKARFVSTKVIPTGANQATIEGNLTFHGVTKPFTLKAHLVGVGVNPIDKAYTVGFEAEGALKRTEFGVSAYAPMIGDTVHLTIHGAFELKP
ncbi:YceI family protein [Rhodoblastus acidophilus]|uniref:YceI family protein n=1 Tax=Candidatus Rhodoblastus alkanivorans TaxID=2954117 RepID=A0ABS9Z6D6_9HYPH|nr:YceI family protein [Candidatus Rhodoblastus alkanivorans]MCI4679709.1 YceI family protein [Candidatus Rhodoblastus alkanivorans]MCI4683229.1 YceI family protein [Candidatus Rhodoblastus alkanivorans]MDI4640541.1 YceI family protein [Rhodoblastus acidophilus]